MKKLLFVPYTVSNGGGSERIFRLLVNGLDVQKYDIDVQEFIDFNKSNEKFNSNIHFLPPILDTKRDSAFKIKLIERLVLFFPFLFRKKRKKYDVEIAFNYQIPTCLLDYSSHTVCWNHGTIEELRKSRIRFNVQKKSFSKCDKIVSIADMTTKSIIDLYPEIKDKIVCIPNGFDFEEIYQKSLIQTSNSIEPKSVLFCGRFDQNKNPLRMINIFNKVLKFVPDSHLYFAGNGDLESQMLSLINSLGIKENVHILGRLNNPYPVMRQVKAICVCSDSEGFPTVICEGMALSKPFISTNVGGAMELSNNGNLGYVVDSDEQFQEALIKIFEDDTKYKIMTEQTRDFIEQYSLYNQIEKVEKLIDSLC